MAALTNQEPSSRAVPPRALVISFAALAVAVAGAVFFPDSMAEYSFLAWLLALVPAFLLCFYRSWTHVMYLLGGSMVLLSLGYVAGLVLGWTPGDWPVFVFVLTAYIGIALGMGWLGELRAAVQQREQAERFKRQADEDLRRSYGDLKLAQWKLIEAEKLEAVGQLAAGVAHEVKNPLMTLLTGVRYLDMHLKDASGDVRVLLEDMREAVTRADAVITGLLDFSAPHELNPTPSNLNSLVSQSVKLVKHEIDRAQVTLCSELDEAIPVLDLDHLRIQQVLVNLFTNAAHATPSGGTITVKTYTATKTDTAGGNGAPGSDHGKGKGESVALEVEDTGAGIPEENLGKLFNPFFTTKQTGKGTGLGLAVSRQIVEMHGATINIQNRDGGGTRVTIVFPVHEEGLHGGQEAYPAG